ncbi:MAG: hypothetical protein Q7S23_06060 [bacterium]|nr:hypothetical protein [bacterium]
MPWQYRLRRKPPPRLRTSPEPAPLPLSPLPPPQQIFLPGVDPLIAEVTCRCCPLRQPDILVYGPTLKSSNLAELARRSFRVHYLQDTRMLWGSQCLEAGRFLLEHQRDRLENTAGTYRLLPLQAATVDAGVVAMGAPFENCDDLLVTLCELKRVLRTNRRHGSSEPFILLRGIIPSLPQRKSGKTAIPLTADGLHWPDIWPLAAESGFKKLDPVLDAIGLDIHDDPPTFTWRLTPA